MRPVVLGALHPDRLEACEIADTLYKHDNDFDMICVSFTTVDRLEDFFSAPEFTCSVRAFVDEHDSSFVYVSGEADFAFLFFVHPRISPTNHKCKQRAKSSRLRITTCT